MTARVLILGGNVDGLNAVLHITHALKDDVHEFDYLVIATGYRNTMDVAEGFEQNANQIATLYGAIRNGETRKRFLGNPSPIVIGPPSPQAASAPRRSSCSTPAISSRRTVSRVA